MMVLIGDTIYILSRRHLAVESRKRYWLFPSHRHIVEMHRTSRLRQQGDGILF